MHLGHGPSSTSEIFEGYQCYEFELHFQFYNVMDYDGASSQWLNNMLRQRLTQRQLHEIIQPTASSPPYKYAIFKSTIFAALAFATLAVAGEREPPTPCQPLL